MIFIANFMYKWLDTSKLQVELTFKLIYHFLTCFQVTFSVVGNSSASPTDFTMLILKKSYLQRSPIVLFQLGSRDTFEAIISFHSIQQSIDTTKYRYNKVFEQRYSMNTYCP